MEVWLRKNGWQYKAFAYALPSGAATWRDEWKELFIRHNHTFICLDDDDAGRVAEAIETADEWLAPVMELVL